MEDHDAIAGAISADAFADRGNFAGRLVSEDARRGMRASGNFFEVGAADSTGVHADEHFTGANRGDGDGFEADIVHAAVNGGLHGRGDSVQGSFDAELSSNGHRK